jgi:hypothetical protein
MNRFPSPMEQRTEQQPNHPPIETKEKPFERIRGIPEEAIQMFLGDEIKEAIGTNNKNLHLFLQTLLHNPERIEVGGYFDVTEGRENFVVKKISMYDENDSIVYFKDLDKPIPKEIFKKFLLPNPAERQ